MRTPEQIQEKIDEMESDIEGNDEVQQRMRMYVEALEWVLDGDEDVIFGEKVDKIQMVPGVFDEVHIGASVSDRKNYVAGKTQEPGIYYLVREKGSGKARVTRNE